MGGDLEAGSVFRLFPLSDGAVCLPRFETIGQSIQFLCAWECKDLESCKQCTEGSPSQNITNCIWKYCQESHEKPGTGSCMKNGEALKEKCSFFNTTVSCEERKLTTTEHPRPTTKESPQPPSKVPKTPTLASRSNGFIKRGVGGILEGQLQDI
ncbi:hypothetical protein L345_14417, partial [Ophiophagus hannah]